MAKIDPAHKLITLAEAAKRYGLSHDYLRRIAGKGRLQAQKVGRDWLTTPEAVEEYIASRQRRGAYRDDLEG
jgi:excisionase family DNA binding protein